MAVNLNELKMLRKSRKLKLNGTPCGRGYRKKMCNWRSGKENNEECLRCNRFLADNPYLFGV